MSDYIGGSFNNATRTNTGLLAALERQTLLWLAARMPAAICPDHLTGLALASMLIVGASFAASSRAPQALWGVVAGLALNWFGDSLDGTLARVRRQERPRYGFYVDHVFDSFGALFVLGGLALSGWVTPAVAAAVLIAYFLLSIETYLATYSVGRFEMSRWGLGPTELRIALALGTLALFFRPMVTILGRRLLLFDVGGLVAAAGMVITAGVATIRHARALSDAEPLVPRLAALEVLHDLSDDVLRVAKEH